MEINVLLKLSKLKQQRINSLRSDFLTLEKIVVEIEKEYIKHNNSIAEFIKYYANNKNYCDNTANILNGRLFLEKLNTEKCDLETSKLEAEVQKEAAFNILKESALELMQLKKAIQKEHKLELDMNIRKELLVNDTLEIYRQNGVKF